MGYNLALLSEKRCWLAQKKTKSREISGETLLCFKSEYNNREQDRFMMKFVDMLHEIQKSSSEEWMTLVR